MDVVKERGVPVIGIDNGNMLIIQNTKNKEDYLMLFGN